MHYKNLTEGWDLNTEAMVGIVGASALAGLYTAIKTQVMIH